MVRVSNFVLGVVNFCFMLLGLAAVGFSLYLHLHGGTHCQKLLQNPLLITGGFLFVVSLLGVIGSCCRSNVVMFLYLVIMFLLILGLIVFTLFAFFITNKGAGQALSNKGIKEHKTWDFSNWLRNHFAEGKNWEGVKECLIDAQVCRSLGNDVSHMTADFYKKNLSPIQSGCCKPPSDCGFEFKNATWWEAPKTGGATEDGDCSRWSNDQNLLCYDCNSCKAGFLENVRKEWKMIAIFNVCLVILLIILYAFGCCAKRNNRKDRKRYGYMA